MNALIVLTHPNSASFGHAIFEAARDTLLAAGHEVKTRSLYDRPFKTALDGADSERLFAGEVPADVRAEQELIAWADLLVFVYPVWWYDRPALLKGWIDRVWTSGFAFKYTPDGVQGLLAGKAAVVFQTTGAPRDAYMEHQEEDAIVRPMRDGTLRFCGLDVPAYRTFYAVPYVSPEDRQAMLNDVRETLTVIAASPAESRAS